MLIVICNMFNVIRKKQNDYAIEPTDVFDTFQITRNTPDNI